MNSHMVTVLAGHVATVVEDGIPVTNITMGEMADGSRRSYALVTVQGVDEVPGNDVTYRITSPAPDNAPYWARERLNRSFVVEIDTGDFWEEIETLDAEVSV